MFKLSHFRVLKGHFKTFSLPENMPHTSPVKISNKYHQLATEYLDKPTTNTKPSISKSSFVSLSSGFGIASR